MTYRSRAEGRKRRRRHEREMGLRRLARTLVRQEVAIHSMGAEPQYLFRMLARHAGLPAHEETPKPAPKVDLDSCKAGATYMFKLISRCSETAARRYVDEFGGGA